MMCISLFEAIQYQSSLLQRKINQITLQLIFIRKGSRAMDLYYCLMFMVLLITIFMRLELLLLHAIKFKHDQKLELFCYI